MSASGSAGARALLRARTHRNFLLTAAGILTSSSPPDLRRTTCRRPQAGDSRCWIKL
jgi:hypothetical protein